MSVPRILATLVLAALGWLLAAWLVAGLEILRDPDAGSLLRPLPAWEVIPGWRFPSGPIVLARAR